jgi:hypothetical protein
MQHNDTSCLEILTARAIPERSASSFPSLLKRLPMSTIAEFDRWVALLGGGSLDSNLFIEQ